MFDRWFFPHLAPRERYYLLGGLAWLLLVGVINVTVLKGLSKGVFGANGQDGYIELARTVMAGGGFRFAPGGPVVLFHPPVYVAFLTPIVLFPENWQPWLVIVLNGLFFWAAGCIMYLLAGKWFNRAVARWSLLLFWLNPGMLWCIKIPMYYLASTFILAAMVYWTWRTFNRPVSRTSTVALGLCAGVAILLHGTYLLIVALTGWGMVLGCLAARRWDRLLSVSVAGAIALAIMLPWTWRNYAASGRFIPVVEGAGANFYFSASEIGLIPPHAAPQPLAPRAFNQGGDSRTLLELAGMDGNLSSTSEYGYFASNSGIDIALDQAMFRDIREAPWQLVPRAGFNAVQMFFPLIRYVLRPYYYKKPDMLSVTFFFHCLITLVNLAYFLGAWWGWRGLRSPAARRCFLCLAGGIIIYVAPYLPFNSMSFYGGYAFPSYIMLIPLAALGAERLRLRFAPAARVTER